MIKIISDSKKLILSGLLIKVLAGTFFASYFLSDLFIPFINFFVLNLENPYAQFLGLNSPESFPYPALMLFLMSLPVFLAEALFDLSDLPEQVSYFIYRLPLLIADMGILLILSFWAREESHRKLILLYWFSPVLFYISYVHGQLDVIPIFFLFFSLNYLFKQKILLAGLVFGFALSTKTMVLLSLPFIILYLLSKEKNIKNIFIFVATASIFFFCINLPFIFDPSFQEMVFNNSGQSRIFELSFPVGETYFFFIPACLLILIVRGFMINTYSKDIFLMFLGFSFGIILMFITPMQGWYYWLIPFLTYFYAKSEDNSFVLLLVLQISYLLYFALVENSDYLKVFSLLPSSVDTLQLILIEIGLNPDSFQGIAFTILQVSLGVNCYFIYRKGIDSYSKHKITSAPYLVGVGGDSGVGKTTLAKSLSNIFTSMNSIVIRGDDMHKWQRGHEKWEEFNHLDPKANLLHQEIGMLNSLKSGKSIIRKTYNHDDGTFSKDLLLSPNNLIIFEGLHPFYLSRQRQLYDVKIFIEPDKNLSDHWKIKRDMAKRGYSKEKVLEVMNEREEDSLNFVKSQAKYSDILISPKSVREIQDIGSEEEIDIKYNLSMTNSIFLESLIEELNSLEGLSVSHKYTEEDRQEIKVSGEASFEEISSIAKTYIPSLADLGVDYPNWSSDSLGIIILILTFFIFEDADYGKE